jgi:hypothetical protein
MRRRRGWRVAGLVLLGVVLLLAVARLALEPVVERRTRQALARMDGLWGTFSHLDIDVLKLSYTLHDLRIDKVTKGGQRTPYFAVRRIDAGLYWRELLHRQLVGGLGLFRPKLEIHAVAGPEPADAQADRKAPADAPEDLGRVLQKFVPFTLDRAEAREGEIVWVNERVPERPRLRFHGLEGTLENFATRAALARGEPSVLALSGTMQRTGRISVYASADPLAKGLTFAGQARLEGLKLVELGELLAATTGLAPKQGTLTVNARFKAVDGHLSGGVRPLLEDPEVGAAKPGLGEKIKAGLADLALDLMSDRVPGRKAVATTIPIEGDVTDPDAKLWPTVFAIVRNAFVTGLADSMAGLPPPEAHQQESPRTQARRAPSVKSGTPREKGEGR